MKFSESDSNYEENKTNSKAKITEYSYLLQRKCLRMMRRYYKEKFEKSDQVPNYKKQVRHLTLIEMNEAINNFAKNEFDLLRKYEEYTQYICLEESLKTLILWDRYNKREPIIEGLSFDTARDVFNRFNTRNLIQFFSDKAFALLFVHYFENQSEVDATSQSDVEPSKLMQEMRTLYDEADRYLSFTCEQFAEYKRQQKLIDLRHQNDIKMEQEDSLLYDKCPDFLNFY